MDNHIIIIIKTTISETLCKHIITYSSHINHQSYCSLLTTGSSHTGNNDLSNATARTPSIILYVWPPDWSSIQIKKAVFLRALNQISLIHQIQEVTSTVSELTMN